MTKRHLLTFIRYAFLFTGVLLVVFPMLFIFISSFKHSSELYGSPWALPAEWDFSPYIRLFTEYGFGRAFFNSARYSMIGCVATALLITPCAYSITRMRWRLSKLALGFVMLGIMIPIHAIVIPLYATASKVNIPSTTMLQLIFIATSIPTSLFIMCGFMETIPYELEEAAVLDACSIPQAFWHIVCPLVTPSLATITILNFNSIWNDYMLSLIFLSGGKYQTVQLAVTNFDSSRSTNYPMLLSAIIVVLIPSVIVCCVMTDKLTAGITAGAVKG